MNNQPIEFKLTAIQIESKAMSPSPVRTGLLNYIYEIKVENRVQVENKLVMVFVFVKIKHEDYLLAILDTVLAFEIVEFEKFITLNEDGLHYIPAELDNIIKPVSISTVRGIIYSEFRGTYLHDAIMPVVFMNQFKENMIEDKNIKE